MIKSTYEVKEVVCDYGVFVDGELRLIVNSKASANLIVEILVFDELSHQKLNDFSKR